MGRVKKKEKRAKEKGKEGRIREGAIK